VAPPEKIPGIGEKLTKEMQMSDVSLFVRKASGLVRAWSVFDAFIYATFSINLITLGLFIFSYCYYLQGSLITGVVIGAIFTIFEVIVYASLISAMPRAGGDYVWQSRILNRAIGFVLSVTGWWFILWLWTPLYGQMLTYEVYTPLLAIAGFKDAALVHDDLNGSIRRHAVSVSHCIYLHRHRDEVVRPGAEVLLLGRASGSGDCFHLAPVRQ
jgi:hypothetical protein